MGKVKMNKEKIRRKREEAENRKKHENRTINDGKYRKKRKTKENTRV